jgi:CheY-like chemotaxis protein/two-component sensor histidine kinase
VHQSARVLLSLLNDILDFSRAEAGKLELEETSFDLRESVAEVADLLREQAQRKDLELQTYVDDEVPRIVRGDAVRVRQVLMNLVGNALKFTDTGGIQISVMHLGDTEAGDPDVQRQSIEFAVTDTGIGVPDDARESIFQMFTQADGSMARRYGGTGLGLAICQQLVELMGGEMGFETQEGDGSRFWFRIDVEDASDSQPAIADADRLEGLRGLVVDDNATNRTVQLHHLRSWGIEAVECEDGMDAIPEIRGADQAGRPFHFVLLDMVMPGMSGLEVAEALRAEPLTSQPRLILLASLDGEISASEIEHAGIDLRLTKPVRKADLEAAIRETAASPSARSSATQAPEKAPLPLDARVLLVEDNIVNQEVALGMLRALGCDVTAVCDGQAAIEAVEGGSWDLVFMDCQMPIVDGFEATERIRERENSSASRVAGAGRTRIVALTAHAKESDRRECIAAGMDDYLSKPFSKEDLRGMVLKWVSGVDPDPVDAPETLQRLRETPASVFRSGRTTLDRGVLIKLRALEDQGGSKGLVERVVDAYLKSSSDLVQQMEQAAQSGALEAVAKAAHTLKSSSAQVGALRLSDFCREIQRMLQHPDSAGLAELLSETHAELDAAHDQLEAAHQQLEAARAGSSDG